MVGQIDEDNFDFPAISIEKSDAGDLGMESRLPLRLAFSMLIPCLNVRLPI
jgi:hypothetical protein